MSKLTLSTMKHSTQAERGSIQSSIPGTDVAPMTANGVDDPKDTRAQTFDMHAQDKTAQFNP